MNRAVLYLRSSKDRHDVSIDAQRRELTALALAKNLIVVGEFADPVERADDEDRPGLGRLLRELTAHDRAWAIVIMLDTSRLARAAQGFAFFFDRECEKHGVRVIYKVLPDEDPVMGAVFRQVIRAFDLLHSLMSKRKGLAGMAENVRQGHRAGGRAPYGYRLVHEPSGATRDGAPVMKSRLEVSGDAPKVAEYLRQRAAGIPRARAKAIAQLDLADTSLIGIERNALTYAGATVWNVHAQRVKGGYSGGTKRRPRADWVVQDGTHHALIARAEAEALLARLDAGSRQRARPAPRTYLLAGLLMDPAGDAWHGDRGNYRMGKGRKVSAERLERAVLDCLSVQLQQDEVVHELTRRLRALYAADQDNGEAKRLTAAARDLTRSIERVSGMLADTSAPAALLRSIEGWEAERTAAMDRISHLEERAKAAAQARQVRAADVRRLLRQLVSDLEAKDPQGLKDALRGFVDRVTLDPETYACTLRFRMKSGDKVASPRGFELIPPLEWPVTVPANRTYVRRAA